eukprot:278858_1
MSTSIMTSSSDRSANDNEVVSSLLNAGYTQAIKIADSMQGSVWRSLATYSNSNVVIKAANKSLHNMSMVVINGLTYSVYENIVNETAILKYLTEDTLCPKSLVKYLNGFESNDSYFLVMQDGHHSLFNFTQSIHQYIESGHIEVADWHRMVKIIVKQMVECIEYIHSKGVCHFDISLENFLIDNIDVQVHQKDGKSKVKFCFEDTPTVKLCDFGIAEYFPNGDFTSNKFCGKKHYRSPEVVRREGKFNAMSNDTFCLGVCVFMLIIGTAPWVKAHETDKCFEFIMNGHLTLLLQKMGRVQYVNNDLMDLFNGLFEYEGKRMDIESIKKSAWLNC